MNSICIKLGAATILVVLLLSVGTALLKPPPPFDVYHCSPSCLILDDDARYSHLACWRCLQRLEQQGYVCGVDLACPPDAVGVDPTIALPPAPPYPEDER